jgi:peroxiredoxin (alkyl hydroperoxide reductase subunit C)
MTVKPGDTLPDATLSRVTASDPEPVQVADFFHGRKIVLFAVPGAFTPTCSAQHLPSFLHNIEAIRAKGVDEVACVAVNDPFVLKAWAEDQGIDGDVTMLADGSGLFTHAIGMDFDLVSRGLGVRSQRYAMIVDDGRITHLGVEPPGAFGVSSGEAVLEALG